MKVALAPAALDPWAEVSAHQRSLRPGAFGATAVFVGTMRDFNDDETVEGMFLEHYPGMTEAHLERIAGEAMQRWDLLDVLLVHRVGEIAPGEPIVVTAAWSAHRAAAFAACRYLMEELKSRAPFWKKERLRDGERWVASNTPAEE